MVETAKEDQGRPGQGQDVKTAKRRVRVSKLERLAQFILVMIGAIAIGMLTAYLVARGFIPGNFALPIYAGVTLVAGYLVIVIVTAILEGVVEPTLGITRAHGIKNVFQIVAGALLVASILAILGVNVTSVLIGAGFAGIVLGLAAQQVLGNVFAGISLLVSRPFKIGDRITLATSSYSLTGSTYSHESEVNGFTGVVQDIGIFFTNILLDDGNPSIFPNSVVIAALIINHSRIVLRGIRVRIDLDKKLDYTTFKSKMLQLLNSHDELDADRSAIELVGIGDDTYQVAINAWARGINRDAARTIINQDALAVQQGLTSAMAATLPKVSETDPDAGNTVDGRVG